MSDATRAGQRRGQVKFVQARATVPSLVSRSYVTQRRENPMEDLLRILVGGALTGGLIGLAGALGRRRRERREGGGRDGR